MLPADGDVDAFLDSVSEASRLIDGLKAGVISPEFVDTKIAQRSQKQTLRSPAADQPLPQDSKAAQAADKDAADTEAARQAELLRKVEELKANRQRKQRARSLYESYVQGKKQQQHSYATDYNKWELWCPSDDDDDLFNSLTPNSPEFRAMEKDISKRHERMVEQRQIAERQRQLGNTAFKEGQWGEALRCYEQGLESQRHNMTLHANAAMAALKLKCYIAAQEHCDKVLHLAEVLHNTPQHPLCVKALQRRAAAHQGLGQHSKAVADLQAAADIKPGDDEVTQQLKRAQALLQEHKTSKQLARLVKPDAQKEQQRQEQQQGQAPKQQSDDAQAASQPAAASQTQGCSSSTANAAVSSTAKDPAASGSSTGECSSSSSGSVKPAATSRPSAPGDAREVAHLQRIEQLVSALSSSASQADDSQQQTQTCQELIELLKEPRYRVHFRGCGGLDTTSKLVVKATEAATQAAALQLLNTACDTDTALEQLPDPVLGTVLDLIGSHHRAALAALELSYSASICSTVRNRLCAQLVKTPRQQQQQGAGSMHSCERLASLWEICSCAPAGVAASDDSTRVVAVSLLSNCMLVPAVRAAILPLLQQQQQQQEQNAQGLNSLAKLLAPDCHPALAVKVFGLLSNMCSTAGLRTALAACQPLVHQVLQSASTAPQGEQTGAVVAAMGCLCNLSLEQGVVQQLSAAGGDTVAHLLQLTAAGSASFQHNCADSIERDSRVAPSAAPKLPPRGKGKSAGVMPQLQKPVCRAGDIEDCILSVRAATVLSRVAKQAAGLQQLQSSDALGVFARAIPECLQAVLSATPPQHAAQQQQQHQQPSAEGKEAKKAAVEWLSAAVRSMALMTAAAEATSSCSPATATAVIAACCTILRSPVLEDSMKGNAALILKAFAADDKQQWHALLAKEDAVEALVTAARAGKGSPSSRNAGIALAVLARAGGAFIERMRELRGLEVLYGYVRPA